MPLLVQKLGTLLQVFLCYVMLKIMKDDPKALSLAYSVTNLLMFATVLVFSKCMKSIRDSIMFPNRAIFTNLGQYIRIAFPSMVLVVAGWWAFEIIIILSGLLGQK